MTDELDKALGCVNAALSLLSKMTFILSVFLAVKGDHLKATYAMSLAIYLHMESRA